MEAYPPACYVDTVTLRHAALPAGAVLLLGVGVYLFHEVRTEPAIAQVEARTPRPPPVREEQPPSPPPIRVGTGIVPQPQAQPPTPAPRPISDQIKEELPPAPDTREVRFNSPNMPADEANAKLDAVMAEANKAYDHGDFDEAKVIAQKVLAKNPNNVRMLRIMVSSSCIDGDTAMAQANFPKLPAADQEQMRVRCARYGVTFDGAGK